MNYCHVTKKAPKRSNNLPPSIAALLASVPHFISSAEITLQTH